MRSRKLGRGTAAALVAAMMAAGCAEGGDGELGAGSLDGDVTGVSLSLTTVPTDAKCYRATFTSGSTSVVKTASPTAGSTTPVTFTGLTSSTTYALTLEVFDLACGSVVATTPIVWTGSASNVLVINGMLTPVTIVLRRPAGTAVTVDYDSSIVLSQGSGTSIYDIAVQEPNVYAARGAFVERVPVTGGGVEIVATGQSITEVAADATGYYYCDSYTPAFYWVPPGQARRTILSNRAPYSLTAAGGGLLTVWASTNGNGTVERYTTAGGLTTVASAIWNVSKAVSDGTVALWMGSTSAGIYTIGKSTFAGVAGPALYNAPSGSALSDLAADATYVYFAQTGLPGASNGILRVPVAGGAATAIATPAAGTPSRVLVDATNVYYVVRITDASGSCTSSSINKVPKAGGTVTTLFSRAGTCPTSFAQSSTQLFFDAGIDLRRIDK
jgi:hypothetical protein